MRLRRSLIHRITRVFSLQKDINDYYEILGVSKDASLQQIKERYAELIKIYHPDVSTLPKPDAKYIKIKEAFEELRKKKKPRLITYKIKRGQSKHVICDGNDMCLPFWLKQSVG